MIYKQNDATNNRPEGSRPLEADYISLSFAERIAQLKSEKAWAEGDRNAITLLHHPRLRLVLMAMREGAWMNTHTADGPITIQTLEGAIEVEVCGKHFPLLLQEAIAIEGRVPHSVKALSEAVFLLTLGPGEQDTF